MGIDFLQATPPAATHTMISPIGLSAQHRAEHVQSVVNQTVVTPNDSSQQMDAARAVWGKVDLARAGRRVEASVEIGAEQISVSARNVRGGVEIAISAPGLLAAAANQEREHLRRELSDAGLDITDIHVSQDETPRRRRERPDEGEQDA